MHTKLLFMRFYLSIFSRQLILKSLQISMKHIIAPSRMIGLFDGIFLVFCCFALFFGSINFVAILILIPPRLYARARLYRTLFAAFCSFGLF